MTTNIEATFVGGPWDGERRSVERVPVYVVPVMDSVSLAEARPTESAIRHYHYNLQQGVRSDGSIEWRYVCES